MSSTPFWKWMEALLKFEMRFEQMNMQNETKFAAGRAPAAGFT